MEFWEELREQKEMEMFREEQDKKQFEAMKPLPLEQVEKMNATRCLSYYRKLRDVIPDRYWEEYAGNPFISAYANQVKAILETKPHVPKKAKKAKVKKPKVVRNRKGSFRKFS